MIAGSVHIQKHLERKSYTDIFTLKIETGSQSRRGTKEYQQSICIWDSKKMKRTAMVPKISSGYMNLENEPRDHE